MATILRDDLGVSIISRVLYSAENARTIVPFLEKSTLM